MIQQTVYHEPKSKYAYVYNGNNLHIRIRVGVGEAKKIKLVAFDPFNWVPDPENPPMWKFDGSTVYEIKMDKEHKNRYFDYWFAEIPNIETLRIRYGFLIETEDDTYYYGPHGFFSMDKYKSFNYKAIEFFGFPYLNEEDSYKSPKWVKDTVWYQIFTERFCNGDTSNDAENTLPWASREDVNFSMSFGGDLQGVIQKLDYLKGMGINGVYFTPIFESPSAHKYDTTDYLKIDPYFGTNETFKTLVDEAHSRGIKVMLDAVFNHCGYNHPFWQDVLKNGKNSKYYGCFYIENEKVGQFPTIQGASKDLENLTYRSFAYEPIMPKWNTSNEIAREYLIGVGKYWVEKYNIDGWRLDVSNEVSHDFWREFRKEIKKINSDVYINGENWDNSFPWLQGDQFDAVMNYELLNIIWNFIGNKEMTTDKYNSSNFVEELGNYFVNYPKYLQDNMFNLLDSHDTARIMTVCGENIKKVKLAYVLQMIMPGSPSIYYGSEIGLTGIEDGNRKCMIWDDNIEKHELYKHIKSLIELRKNNKAMSSNKFEWINIDEKNNSFILKKISESQSLYLLLNNSEENVEFKNPINNDEIILLEPFGYKILEV